MNPSISIIGLGWMGTPLAQYLLSKGFLVKGSTRTNAKLEKLDSLGIETILMDFNDLASTEKALFDADYIFLNVPPGRSSPDAVNSYANNMARLIEFINSECKVIFASSTGVYGNLLGHVDESAQTNPQRRSSKAILEVEKQVMGKFKSYCILRFGGLVGPDRKAGAFLAGKKNLIEGERPVNLIHLEDCIGILYTCISQDLFGQIFNAVCDLHPSRKSFYRYRSEIQGLEQPEFEPGGSESKIVSNLKIKSMSGYTFKYPDPMEFPI